MSDYITDPDLLSKLNGTSDTSKPAAQATTGSNEYINDPELLKKLNDTGEDISSPPDTTPAPQFAVPGPTGINMQAIKDTVAPLANAGKSALGGYVKNPIEAIVDYGAMHLGIPPPYATKEGLQGLYNTYNAAKTSLNTAQGLASKISETPGVESSFNKIIDALPKADALRMSDLINKRGAQGLKEFLNSAPEAIKAMPEAKQLVDLVPGTMQQIGKVVSPALRAVGKVAGPAGLAMNAYDASQYAQQANLGPRLAAGQGSIAQKSFRNMQHTSGTQYQLQPQEAANLLASNDQRTIQMYGGPDRLQQIAGGLSPSAPPTSNNFIDRMKAMAHQYGQIGNQ